MYVYNQKITGRWCDETAFLHCEIVWGYVQTGSCKNSAVYWALKGLLQPNSPWVKWGFSKGNAKQNLVRQMKVLVFQFVMSCLKLRRTSEVYMYAVPLSHRSFVGPSVDVKAVVSHILISHARFNIVAWEQACHSVHHAFPPTILVLLDHINNRVFLKCQLILFICLVVINSDHWKQTAN